MSGNGSGNYYRWRSSTTKIEDVHKADTHFLKKQGYLAPGTYGSLSWTCGGEPTGDIRFETKHGAIHLIYKHRRYDESWQPRNERITFRLDILQLRWL